MDLRETRKQIDWVDEELLRLFSQRMHLSAQAAAAKRAAGLPLSDATREEEILNRVGNLAGQELAEYARALFATLFTLSKEYQARL